MRGEDKLAADDRFWRASSGRNGRDKWTIWGGKKYSGPGNFAFAECPKEFCTPDIWDAAKGAGESPPLERESSVKPVRIRRGIVPGPTLSPLFPWKTAWGGPTRSAFGYLSSLGPRPFGNTRSNTRLVKHYFVKHGFVFWQENRFRDAIVLRIFTYFKRERMEEIAFENVYDGIKIGRILYS